MTIHHHPDDATLMSFAAGSLNEALAAVVACHAGMCPKCTTTIREMELIGSTVMCDLHPESVPFVQPSGRFRTALERPGRHAVKVDPLARLLPLPLDQLQWKRIGLGVHTVKLPLSASTIGDLRLLRIAAGTKVPEHGHGGSELTLILKGAYTDSLGRFAEGDVADVDAETEHQPVVEAVGECICLVASESKARFRGLARLLQPFIGF